ncbi:MAG: ATP synthase F0 subunit B [Elusimicrobia bacterium RIFCSPLOWO2_02_FULL_39_32]|nr:MAG: ATP synthase F0 subunit B [Elusimicrobia bacterium GWA2_38_7]OGR78456.1 MAG: ATP synthase F0 subunit B [Elusimicrobia bacterium RIFCSPHIGHO2_02_FULL_39_36]OGR92215.1 MAG: ATP synthase F0 subunit B [Elusimicrobia bacterium RIFCSPLOWO2_02_FULL_39_32]OGR99918.1 MAG: ATP synthase F0 subunit B [Elusimicrobia bacterium RIFCSPLOWO2_12_FULL_39_28]
MENLLKPDVGLMFWTVVTFLAMVFILKKLAWIPILKLIDEREAKLKNEIEAAEKNKEDLEKLKKEYEVQLAEIQSRTQVLLGEAEKKGLQIQETILKTADAKARQILEKGKEQLNLEKDKLLADLKKEVGSISLLMAEKLLQQSVDKKVQEKFLQDFLADLKDYKKEKSYF